MRPLEKFKFHTQLTCYLDGTVLTRVFIKIRVSQGGPGVCAANKHPRDGDRRHWGSLTEPAVASPLSVATWIAPEEPAFTFPRGSDKSC